jgi:hypothetical protein
VDWYDTATGELMGSNVAPTAPAAVNGTSGAIYAGGAGFKVSWETGQVRDGRRVRGSTFIVPAASSAFSATGTVAAASRTTVNTAAATMIAAMHTGSVSLGVWSRPREATETLPARDGAPYEVLQGICSAKSAILRGRRD